MEIQEDFYPSEVDRLVLGHLQESGASCSFQVFLAESGNLKEHFDHFVKQNKWRSLTANGKTLKEILSDYCRLKRQSERNESDSRGRRNLSEVASKEEILCNKCVQTEPLSTCASEFVKDHVDTSLVSSTNEESACDHRRLKNLMEDAGELMATLKNCCEKVSKCQRLTVENLQEIFQPLQQYGTKLSVDSPPRESEHTKTEAISRKSEEVCRLLENTSKILSEPDILKACETNPAISKDSTDMSKKNPIPSVCYKNIIAVVEGCEEKAENVQQKSESIENRTTCNQSTATLQNLNASGLLNNASTSGTLINSSIINTFQSNLTLSPTLNPGRFFNLQKVHLSDSSLQYCSMKSSVDFLNRISTRPSAKLAAENNTVNSDNEEDKKKNALSSSQFLVSCTMDPLGWFQKMLADSISIRPSARQAAENNSVNSDNELDKMINTLFSPQFLDSRPMVDQKKLRAEENKEAVQAQRMGLKKAMEEWKRRENSARNAENMCSSSMPGGIGSSTLQGTGCQQKDIMQLGGNFNFREKVSPPKKIVSSIVPKNSTTRHKKRNRNMSKKSKKKYRKEKMKALLKASNISRTKSHPSNFSPKSSISETIENVVKACTVDNSSNDNIFASVSPSKENTTVNKIALKSDDLKSKDTPSNKIKLRTGVSEKIACDSIAEKYKLKNVVVVIERLSPDEQAKAMHPHTSKQVVEKVSVHSCEKELSSISKVSKNDSSFTALQLISSPSPCMENIDVSSKTNFQVIPESLEGGNLKKGCKKGSATLKMCSKSLDQNTWANEKISKFTYFKAKAHKFWSCRKSFEQKNVLKKKTAVCSNNRFNPTNKKNALNAYYIKLRSKKLWKYSSSIKQSSIRGNKIKHDNSRNTFDEDNKNTSTPSQGPTSKHKSSPLDVPYLKKTKLTDNTFIVYPSSNKNQASSLSQFIPEYSIISENTRVKVADAQHQVVTDDQPSPIDLSSPHARNLNLSSHAQNLNLSSHAQNLNLSSHAQNLDLSSPHAQNLDLSSPHAQNLDLSSPHAQNLDLSSTKPKTKKHISVATPPRYKREKVVPLRRDLSQVKNWENKSIHFADLAKNEPASIKHATFSHPNILNGMPTSPKMDKSTLSDLTSRAYPVHNKPYHLRNFYSYPMMGQSCGSPASLPHCIRDEIPIPLGNSASFKKPMQYDGPVYEFGPPPTKANQPQSKIETLKKSSPTLKSKVNTDNQLEVPTSNCRSPSHDNNLNFENCYNMQLPRSPCAEFDEEKLICEINYAIKEESIDVNSDRTVKLVSEDEEVGERSNEVEMNEFDVDDDASSSDMELNIDFGSSDEDFNEMEIVPNASVEERACAILSPECEMEEGDPSYNKNEDQEEIAKTLEMLLRKCYQDIPQEKIEDVLQSSKQHNCAVDLVKELKKKLDEPSTSQQ